MEGPFFNTKFSGAHKQDDIQFSEEKTLEEIYGSLDGVKMVTLAPEIPLGIERIKELNQKGIVVSIGHSNATFSETVEAVKAGAKTITHLFNAMTSFHHRHPGIGGYALTHPGMSYSVIADGIHLHDASLLMAWRANPEGLYLVTDAISALGMPTGTYSLGHQEVEVENKKAYLKGTKTMAGSILSMDAAIRNFKKATGCTIIDAIGAATWKPAKIIGIDDRKGLLKIGYDADFVILNDDLEVQACYITGQKY